MRKDGNRTFFYFETDNSAGQNVVRVGSEKAPLWSKSFNSITDAVAAIKRRNGDAISFTEGKNSVTAVYDTPTTTPGV